MIAPEFFLQFLEIDPGDLRAMRTKPTAATSIPSHLLCYVRYYTKETQGAAGSSARRTAGLIFRERLRRES